jgi:uncharacterized membrane protein YuzA (DUF378 family)
MSLNNIEKKYHCPPDALFHPSLLRILYLPIGLVGCWAVVFFKARALEGLPWLSLLVATLFVLGNIAAETWISAHFHRYLAFSIYGFLVGAGVNVIIQGLLNRLHGLTWAFQSPIQFSLGTLLLGFLGSLVFLSHRQQLQKIFSSDVFSKYQDEREAPLSKFLTILWIITALAAIGLCINLRVILRAFSDFESANPLRKPLWFSAGAFILVFVVAALMRKNLSPLVRIVFPGIIVGLAWASIIRDLFQGVYLSNPDFPVAPEVFEALIVINFCYLGIAWLNKAASSDR